MEVESRKMVVDTQNRLTTAVAELRDLVVRARWYLMTEPMRLTTIYRSMQSHIPSNLGIAKSSTLQRPHSMKAMSRI